LLLVDSPHLQSLKVLLRLWMLGDAGLLLDGHDGIEGGHGARAATKGGAAAAASKISRKKNCRAKKIEVDQILIFLGVQYIGYCWRWVCFFPLISFVVQWYGQSSWTLPTRVQILVLAPFPRFIPGFFGVMR
jgi:hypothetical protein